MANGRGLLNTTRKTRVANLRLQAVRPLNKPPEAMLPASLRAPAA